MNRKNKRIEAIRKEVNGIDVLFEIQNAKRRNDKLFKKAYKLWTKTKKSLLKEISIE